MLAANGAKRYCVITPYYKEEREILERCLGSVKRQTVPTDQFFIADGFAQDWLDHAGVRHAKLDRAHGDFGNHARGIGALLAIAEKYDAICFLDADNTYDPDHIETCLAAADTVPGAPYVIAQRRFLRPDHSVMHSVTPADMPYDSHVDTNCFMLLPACYHLLHYWTTFPREFGEFGDKMFYFILQHNLSAVPAVTPKRTVNYLCMYEGVYTSHGEVAPPGARRYMDWNICQAWVNSLSDADLVLARRLTGLQLPRW